MEYNHLDSLNALMITTFVENKAIHTVILHDEDIPELFVIKAIVEDFLDGNEVGFVTKVDRADFTVFVFEDVY